MNSSSGPVKHHKRPTVECSEKGCRRNAVFSSGRCGPCEDAAEKRDFAVLDSYLEEMRR